MSTPYVARTPFRAEHPRVLAIYCSDGRFTTAVEELAAARGHGAVDTLTLPGGPALFDYSASYSDRDAARRATAFLIDRHKIRFVILVAHQGCGHYAERFPRAAGADREKRQCADLAAAARAIREIAPGVRVEAWYAKADRERVSFEPIAIG